MYCFLVVYNLLSVHLYRIINNNNQYYQGQSVNEIFFFIYSLKFSTDFYDTKMLSDITIAVVPIMN